MQEFATHGAAPPNRSPPVTSPGGSSATITAGGGIYAYPSGRESLACQTKLLVHDVVAVVAGGSELRRTRQTKPDRPF